MTKDELAGWVIEIDEGPRVVREMFDAQSYTRESVERVAGRRRKTWKRVRVRPYAFLDDGPQEAREPERFHGMYDRLERAFSIVLHEHWLTGRKEIVVEELRRAPNEDVLMFLDTLAAARPAPETEREGLTLYRNLPPREAHDAFIDRLADAYWLLIVEDARKRDGQDDMPAYRCYAEDAEHPYEEPLPLNEQDNADELLAWLRWRMRHLLEIAGLGAPAPAEATEASTESARLTGTTIRNARTEVGLSLRELAAAVGIGNVEMGEIERGMRLPDADTASAILAAIAGWSRES